MKYKVMRKCAGFRGQLWGEETVGTIIDIDPKEKPPYHFQPMEEVKEPEKAPIDPRAPVEVTPGKTLQVKGGFARELDRNNLGRVLTTDKVPNKIEPPLVRTRRERKKKEEDAGSAKK